jgi:hypothetical protein
MMSQATVLICDSACRDRILSEGGLRLSSLFVAASELEATADAYEPGDLRGLDERLSKPGIVVFDRDFVVQSVRAGGQLNSDQGLARNFIPKLTSRTNFWLACICGSGEEQAGEIQRVVDDAQSAHEATTGQRNCRLVFVLLRPLAAESRALLSKLAQGKRGPWRSIHLMGSELSPGQRGGRVVVAEHVWPMFVARLIAAEVHLPDPGDPNRCRLLAWRAFGLGVSPDDDQTDAYLYQLREALLPANDTATSRALQAEGGKSPCSSSDDPKYAPLEWQNDADEIERDCEFRLDDERFIASMKAAGERPGAKRSSDSPVACASRNRRDAQQEWSDVSKADGGLLELRRMGEGRKRADWGNRKITELHEVQRGTWSKIIRSRIDLRKRRDLLQDEAKEIALARRHHLPLQWRCYIALALVLGIAQFFGSVLEPLRQSTHQAEATASPAMRVLGAEVEGRRVGLLIDRSLALGKAEFEQLKLELAQEIALLDPSVEFSLGGYSEQLALLPECARGPIRAVDANKQKAVEWIRGLTQSGQSNPASVIRSIQDGVWDRVVLLTPAELPRHAVDELKRTLESARSVLPSLDVLALPSGGDAGPLRQLAEGFGAGYRRVYFSPFWPLGFWGTALVLVALTALGGGVGATLPWWLERRAGQQACGDFAVGEQELRRDFGQQVADESVEMMKSAVKVREDAARGSFGLLQQQLASRAHGAVDSAIDAARVKRVAERLPATALKQEDRKDARQTLDFEANGGLTPQPEALKKLVTDDAQAVRQRWESFCNEQDPQHCGHLPWNELRSCLRVIIRDRLEVLHLRLMDGQGHSHGRKALESQLAEELHPRVTQNMGLPLFSLRLASRDGEFSTGKLRLVYAGEGAREARFMGDFRQRVTSPFEACVVDPVQFPLAAAGVLLEEVEIEASLEIVGDDSTCDAWRAP